MKISDADAVHCATYGLGGTYDHEHFGTCEHSTILTAFFDTPFELFLNDIVLKQINDDQL